MGHFSLRSNDAGPGMPNDATEALLQDIGNVLQPVSYYKPQLDVIPLLEFASWSRGKHTQLYINN